MVIISLELTRVNPDWNIFLIKCETKPYFFISMRFGSSSKFLILILTKWNWLIVLMCYINWFNFDWLVILIDLLDDINLLIRWFLLIDWLWLLYVEEREELKRQIVISGITTERPRNLPRDGGSLFCVSNKYFFIIFYFSSSVLTLNLGVAVHSVAWRKYVERLIFCVKAILV